MPRGLFAEELKKKVEPLAVILPLTMLFTFSGLNTRMDMVNSGRLLPVALGVLVASVVAKGGACYLGAHRPDPARCSPPPGRGAARLDAASLGH